MADNEPIKPTTKSLRLGQNLREVRDGLGVTLTAAAQQIGIDKGLLSKIETGKTKRPPTEAQVARILGGLGINNTRYEEIMAIARGADAPQWNATSLGDQAQQSVALVQFEGEAGEIYDVASLLAPGLVQVSSYARAIMSGGTIPAGEIAHQVATRMGRRDVIDPNRTDNPARYTALIDEAVLRRVIGSPAVMVEQLKHLLEVASWKHADIRVIALDAGWTPALSGQFSLIEPRGEGFPIVSMGSRRSSLILHTEEDVAAYREAVDAVLRAAMNPTDTKELIAAVIEEMQRR